MKVTHECFADMTVNCWTHDSLVNNHLCLGTEPPSFQRFSMILVTASLILQGVPLWCES